MAVRTMGGRAKSPEVAKGTEAANCDGGPSATVFPPRHRLQKALAANCEVKQFEAGIGSTLAWLEKGLAASCDGGPSGSGLASLLSRVNGDR
jgi:hypothetical protein